MSERVTRIITAPLSAALLRAVHRTRHELEADAPVVRHLTQALASAAGVPAAAAPWPVGAALPDVETMHAIRDGLTNTRTLRLDHMQQDGQVRPLVIEPYHVELESGYWYLLCRRADSGAERVLRLDKIMAAEIGDPFEPRPVDLTAYLGGVFVPFDTPHVATVRFGPRSAVYAMERWGEGRLLGDGGVEVSIPYQREHFLVRTLAESGGDYQVVGPETLRAGVLTRAKATLALYPASEASG